MVGSVKAEVNRAFSLLWDEWKHAKDTGVPQTNRKIGF